MQGLILGDGGGVPSTAVLPIDVWRIVCEYLSPCDIIDAACVCHDLKAAALSSELWEARLLHAAAAATMALATPRGLRLDPGAADYARDIALTKSHRSAKNLPGGLGTSAAAQFFNAMPHICFAAAAVLKPKAPELCFLSFAQRAYDTTDFVSSHPGGSHHMQRYHGADATKIFDAFPHSRYAHNLMEEKMLRFDAIAYVGRYGAPAFASDCVPQSWSWSREAADTHSDFARDLASVWGKVPWGKGQLGLRASAALLEHTYTVIALALITLALKSLANP